MRNKKIVVTIPQLPAPLESLSQLSLLPSVVFPHRWLPSALFSFFFLFFPPPQLTNQPNRTSNHPLKRVFTCRELCYSQQTTIISFFFLHVFSPAVFRSVQNVLKKILSHNPKLGQQSLIPKIYQLQIT